MELSTWDDLVVLAGSVARARTLLRRGAYRRVLRDLYAPAGCFAEPSLRVEALRRVLPPDAALSHRSALSVVAAEDLAPGPVHVTVPPGRRLDPRRGVVVHHAPLPPEHLTVVDGLLVVTAARAVADVLRQEPLEEAVAVADQALRAGSTSLDLVEDVLRAAAGRRGVATARRALRLLDGRSESHGESVLRVRLVLGGLTDLDVQYDAYDDAGHVARGDLHCRGAWFEFDGWAVHGQKKAFTPDRRRLSALSALGFEVRSFTDVDLATRSGPSLVAEAQRAVEQAATRDRSRVRRGPDTLPRPRLTPLPTLADRQAA